MKTQEAVSVEIVRAVQEVWETQAQEQPDQALEMAMPVPPGDEARVDHAFRHDVMALPYVVAVLPVSRIEDGCWPPTLVLNRPGWHVFFKPYAEVGQAPMQQGAA